MRGNRFGLQAAKLRTPARAPRRRFPHDAKGELAVPDCAPWAHSAALFHSPAHPLVLRCPSVTGQGGAAIFACADRGTAIAQVTRLAVLAPSGCSLRYRGEAQRRGWRRREHLMPTRSTNCERHGRVWAPRDIVREKCPKLRVRRRCPGIPKTMPMTATGGRSPAGDRRSPVAVA